ncbi:MAG: hypothetical protein IPN29_05520 [Saprospiraceae bacterium]|nr:hypothetical protein [Saprospiraceae bacterium]
MTPPSGSLSNWAKAVSGISSKLRKSTAEQKNPVCLMFNGMAGFDCFKVNDDQATFADDPFKKKGELVLKNNWPVIVDCTDGPICLKDGNTE